MALALWQVKKVLKCRGMDAWAERARRNLVMLAIGPSSGVLLAGGALPAVARAASSSVGP